MQIIIYTYHLYWIVRSQQRTHVSGYTLIEVNVAQSPVLGMSAVPRPSPQKTKSYFGHLKASKTNVAHIGLNVLVTAP